MKALIGESGYVGSTLKRQTHFTEGYRSGNIGAIRGKHFDQVVCAAAPAQKWIANRDPDADRRNLDGLIANLSEVSCATLILISTVDVFKVPVGVDELSPVEEAGLHAYGLNRRMLEKFVQEKFPSHLIVRLPGLVGPGLRKNVIYDFLHHNNLAAIDSRGIFQFYPMVNLWHDINAALHAGLRLVHLTAEPVRVSEVAEEGFGMTFDQPVVPVPAVYDMRTRHAGVFGGSGSYQYSRRETMLAIRAYAQSEAVTPPSAQASA